MDAVRHGNADVFLYLCAIYEVKNTNYRMNPIKKTITLPDGREITLETGKLAKQADGAVELRIGNTMLLATVVSAKEAGEGVDFMPLTVDYKEKFSSAGRFPAGSSTSPCSQPTALRFPTLWLVWLLQPPSP